MNSPVKLSGPMVAALQHYAGYVPTGVRIFARYRTVRALVLRGLLDERYEATAAGRAWLTEHVPDDLLQVRCQIFAAMCDKPATGTTVGTSQWPPAGVDVPSCDRHHFNITGQRRQGEDNP